MKYEIKICKIAKSNKWFIDKLNEEGITTNNPEVSSKLVEEL